MFTGLPAGVVHTGLIVGGRHLWRVDAHGLQITAGDFFSGGRGPIAARATVRQVDPVAGGVVALITAASPDGLGDVLFLPSGSARAKVIARAALMAVAPGGHQVWLQHSAQWVRQDGAITHTSRTWAVNLAGRRVTPVLQLPLGLIAVTGSGLIIQAAPAYRLQLWNAASGLLIQRALPQEILAAGRDQIVWEPVRCQQGRCPLRVTDQRTGRATAIRLPMNWGAYGVTAAALDSSGRRLAISLTHFDRSGDPRDQGIFIIDLLAGTITRMPGGPVPLGGDGVTAPAVQLALAWDGHGLLWVLATSSSQSSRRDYYQLGYWTGAGMLRKFPPALGSPMTLAAPGTG